MKGTAIVVTRVKENDRSMIENKNIIIIIIIIISKKVEQI